MPNFPSAKKKFTQKVNSRKQISAKINLLKVNCSNVFLLLGWCKGGIAARFAIVKRGRTGIGKEGREKIQSEQQKKLLQYISNLSELVKKRIQSVTETSNRKSL